VRSHLQRILDTLTTLRSEATRLAGRDHEPSECASLLKDGGGSIETFLKAAAYPSKKKGTFEKLIDDLPTIGAPAVGLPALHLLRQRYNSAKHEHTFAPTTREVIDALDGAIVTLAGWRGLGIGATETPAPVLYRRTLWLASWDHYVHGDGEVQVFLPVLEEETDFPTAIDIIYLKGLAWPGVLDPLGADIAPAQDRIPKKFIDMWESDGDCAGARAFEGEYRDLLRALAQAELCLDLIPFLKREADASSMRTAVAFAAVDVARGWNGDATKKELIEAIQHVAAVDYAAPRAAPLPRKFADSFAALLSNLPPNELGSLTGPRFVTVRKFDELAHSARSQGDGVQISAGFEFVLPI
jgi:hypothetical protein